MSRSPSRRLIRPASSQRAGRRLRVAEASSPWHAGLHRRRHRPDATAVAAATRRPGTRLAHATFDRPTSRRSPATTADSTRSSTARCSTRWPVEGATTTCRRAPRGGTGAATTSWCSPQGHSRRTPSPAPWTECADAPRSAIYTISLKSLEPYPRNTAVIRSRSRIITRHCRRKRVLSGRAAVAATKRLGEHVRSSAVTSTCGDTRSTGAVSSNGARVPRRRW